MSVSTRRAQEASNKATFMHFHGVVNTGDLQLISKMIDEIVEPDAVIRTPVPLDVTGAAALKHVWTVLLQAFPDLHLAVDHMIAEGDKVVVRNTVTGTHRGEYMGLPPTGMPVAYDEIFIFRFANGRVAESWGVVDMLSQMKQLGVIAV
jgi:steroid delta-isomerase-like uncharacterized protein